MRRRLAKIAWALAGSVLSVGVCTAVAAAPSPVTPSSVTPSSDWAAKLRTDAQFVHDDIARNHPGPVDPFDPGFEARNDAGLKQAMDRAGSVHEAAGYYIALRSYIAGFDDTHVNLGIRPWDLPLSPRWPGFLTGFDPNGSQKVLTRLPDAPVPLGAVLESCDGVDAETLARQRVGPLAGRWGLMSQRVGWGGYLLLDFGSALATPPHRCTFSTASGRQDVTLTWRPLPTSEMIERFSEIVRRTHPPIAVSTLSDGTRWVTLSAFDAAPSTPTGHALTNVIDQLRHDRDAVRRAPVIVLDLRGNNGGSSDWSEQIAGILWGDAANQAYDQRLSGVVDWRVSQANRAYIQTFLDSLGSAPGVSGGMRHWAENVVSGLQAALHSGRGMWRQVDDGPPSAAPGAPEAPPKGLVYVLTDFGCASACLDAVDRWRGLGAVQIGQQTGADTYNMEDRSDALPSGEAKFYLPMKVYRNRPRAANVPWTPTYTYTGDMRDTAALQSWVAGLPR